MEREIKVYNGGLGVDDRGTVAFCNGFDFKEVKRFYTVDNSDYMFIRAWHGHKNEGKYVTVVACTAVIGTIDLRGYEYWEQIDKAMKEPDPPDYLTDAPHRRFVLSEKKPQVVWIPPGFINGAMNLDENTKIMYFSTKGLGESEGDDYRFDWDLWGTDFWEIKYR